MRFVKFFKIAKMFDHLNQMVLHYQDPPSMKPVCLRLEMYLKTCRWRSLGEKELPKKISRIMANIGFRNVFNFYVG